jgi:hypothetical protein
MHSVGPSRRLTISAAAAVILGCVLLAAMSKAHSRRNSISLGKAFHVSLGGGGLNFYSDAQYGPYRGSIIGLVGSPHNPQQYGFNMPAYYRHFRWPDGHVMWTLTIYRPLVLLPFCILPLFCLWKAIFRNYLLNRRLAANEP